MNIRAFVLPLVAGGMVTCAFAPNATALATAQQPAAASTAVTATAAATAEPRLLTVDEVKHRLDAGQTIRFVDARGSVSGPVVKGAAHVPVSDADAWAKDVPKDAVVVAYCACPTDGGAKAFVGRMNALGFTNAFALKGGIGAWTAAKMPTADAFAEAK